MKNMPNTITCKVGPPQTADECRTLARYQAFPKPLRHCSVVCSIAAWVRIAENSGLKPHHIAVTTTAGHAIIQFGESGEWQTDESEIVRFGIVDMPGDYMCVVGVE